MENTIFFLLVYLLTITRALSNLRQVLKESQTALLLTIDILLRLSAQNPHNLRITVSTLGNSELCCLSWNTSTMVYGIIIFIQPSLQGGVFLLSIVNTFHKVEELIFLLGKFIYPSWKDLIYLVKYIIYIKYILFDRLLKHQV